MSGFSMIPEHEARYSRPMLRDHEADVCGGGGRRAEAR